MNDNELLSSAKALFLFYPGMGIYIQKKYLLMGVFCVNWGLKIMVDHKQKFSLRKDLDLRQIWPSL